MGLFDFLKKKTAAVSSAIPGNMDDMVVNKVKEMIPDEMEEKMGDIAAKAAGVIGSVTPDKKV
jgi:hypothetical protein